MNFRQIRYFLISAVVIFLSSCSPANRYTQKSHPEDGFFLEYHNYTSLESTEGIASYYGKKHNGRKTASGEIFRSNGFTASHHTYPFGTIIKVTNLNNEHSVLLKVNDRLPVRNKRIVDVSLKAAKELNMVKVGIVKVRVEVLKWGK